MSDDQDRDSKTQDASEKKVKDTIEKGNVPVSREVPVLLSLVSILLVCSLMLSGSAAGIDEMLGALLAEAGTRKLESQLDVAELLMPIAQQSLMLIFPMLLVLMAGGVISSLIQNPFQITFERIEPKASRLSISSGWKRIFGVRGAVDFLKSLFKFASISLILYIIVKSEMPAAIGVMIKPPQLMPAIILEITIKLVSAVAVTALVLAAVDTVWSRVAWRRDLRMSHQEVKEEHKQAEGNPLVKMRAKTLARQRSSRRMMAAVPQATMIIANPTHYAVALRYVRSEGGAPIVLAKGQDSVALKIRSIAEEHGISIVENKPLARAMYEKVEVNAMIPQEFFKAVAELIHFLQMRKVANVIGQRGN
ncbi:MAG: flagellar biosynthesis protein FlhB [Aestuariivirga sp.]